jgi:hypothetical protein
MEEEGRAPRIQFEGEINPVKPSTSNTFQNVLSLSEKTSINGDLENARNIADEDRNRKRKQVCTLPS